MKMKLAFYRAEGNYFDKLIRWWTKSKYSHVEIAYGSEWYSSSYRDNGVRVKTMNTPNPNSWDYVEVDVDEDILEAVFREHKGKGYDWLGILFTQWIPLNIHQKSKCYCSEFCAEVLQLGNTGVSPKELYEILIKEDIITKTKGQSK